MTVIEKLAEIGVLPVVVIDDAADAAPLARALMAGGVPCAEITLRTPAGIASIEATAGIDGFVVGAGTVLSIAQVDDAVRAGARFMVSPGFGTAVIARAAEQSVPTIPGVATATEVMSALDAGLTALKLFPAAQLGGPRAISALGGPFPDVRFVPSGGIDIDNAADYALPTVLSVSTSWIAPRGLIAEGRFAEITERAIRFRTAVTG